MKNLFQKIALASGATLVSAIAFAAPGQASVFYDLKFFDESGELVGTGEFSHEDKPFEEEVCLFTRPSSCNSDSPTLNITSEDGLFKVESFSSTIPGLGFSRLVGETIPGDGTNLFWRNVEDNPLASLRGCTSRGCFKHGGTMTFSDNSWFDAAFFAEYNAIQEMTATGWRSAVLGGILVPPEARFDLSGTWTATRVPEPASIFGLMALGALGTGSVLKRNRH